MLIVPAALAWSWNQYQPRPYNGFESYSPGYGPSGYGYQPAYPAGAIVGPTAPAITAMATGVTTNGPVMATTATSLPIVTFPAVATDALDGRLPPLSGGTVGGTIPTRCSSERRGHAPPVNYQYHHRKWSRGVDDVRSRHR